MKLVKWMHLVLARMRLLDLTRNYRIDDFMFMIFCVFANCWWFLYTKSFMQYALHARHATISHNANAYTSCRLCLSECGSSAEPMPIMKWMLMILSIIPAAPLFRLSPFQMNWSGTTWLLDLWNAMFSLHLLSLLKFFQLATTWS